MVNNKQFINCKERFLIRKHVSSQMLRKAKSRALFWLWTKYLVLQFAKVQFCNVNFFFSDKMQKNCNNVNDKFVNMADVTHFYNFYI